MPDTHPFNEDQFADALDAMVLGMPPRAGADPLAHLAESIQQLGAPDGGDPMPYLPLDRAAKSRIWVDLMRDHDTSDRTPLPQTPGGPASALALNPWVGAPPKRRRTRSSPGVLRFIPEAQPTSTFLLVVAVLVLVGAMFSTLSPDDRRGFVPSASATEKAPAFAATPVASPEVITGTCDPEAGIYSWSPESPYEYEPTGVIASRTSDALGPFFATFSACMSPDAARVGMFASERFMREFRDSLEGTPSPGIEERIASMAPYWTFSLAGQLDVQSFTWEGSGLGEPQRLHVFPETARELADGSLGVLVSITPAGVSPAPDQTWIDRETPGTYAVFLVTLGHGLASHPSFSIDQMIGHCGGADCVAMYGPDAAPQAPLAPDGSIPVNIAIEAAGIDAPVDDQDTFTGPNPLPQGLTRAGWFVDSAAAGGAANMVITGLVTDAAGNPGAFSTLESVPVGSTVEVTAEDGNTYTYTIDAVSPRMDPDDPGYEQQIVDYIQWPVSDGDDVLSIVAFGPPQAEDGGVDYVVVARAVPVDGAVATPNATPANTACATTPVHTEVWPDAPQGSALQNLPWVAAETAGATITGHHFYGDRPLPVNGVYLEDGAVAKVLWTFDRSVQDLTITAINLTDPAADPVTIVTGPANSNDGFSTEWPSNLSLPSSGCWQVSLAAVDKAGTDVTGTVTYDVPEVLPPPPPATPIVAADSDPDDPCVGQPQFLTDDQLREKSIDDWTEPSYRYPFPAEPDVEQAVHDTYVQYLICQFAAFDTTAPDHSSPPDELFTYLSERARFVLMADELSPDQQAGIDAYTFIDRITPLLEEFPLPVNSTFSMTIPTTNPPPADWDNPYDEIPVYHLGDGRYVMMVGSVSSATLRDPTHPTEDDWLMFVAFVEVEGVYYVDEDITLITPYFEEGGTPVVQDDACA